MGKLKNLHMREEDASSTQKGLSRPLVSNPQHCCKTTAPLCHPVCKLLNGISKNVSLQTITIVSRSKIGNILQVKVWFLVLLLSESATVEKCDQRASETGRRPSWPLVLHSCHTLVAESHMLWVNFLCVCFFLLMLFMTRGKLDCGTSVRCFWTVWDEEMFRASCLCCLFLQLCLTNVEHHCSRPIRVCPQLTNRSGRIMAAKL